MGYRGKLMVEHTGIELPEYLVKKETKSHYDILSDLESLLKGVNFNVYAVILWEDGVIDRYNLCTGKQETFNNHD